MLEVGVRVPCDRTVRGVAGYVDACERLARTNDTTTSARMIAGRFVALTQALGGSMVNVVELTMALDEQL
jgi:hypothetical protein